MMAFTFFFYFLNMVIKKFKIMNVADICSSVVFFFFFFFKISEIQLYSDSKRKGMGMTVTNKIPPINIVM